MSVTVSATGTGATLAEALAALGITSTTATSGGSGTPATPGVIPPSTNAYPFAMPANIAAGAPVMFGSGPNRIDIYTANTPGMTHPSQFVVIASFGSAQLALAGPLTCTSYTGETMSESQQFTINGNFVGLTSVEIVSAGNGVQGLWVNELTVDLIPWWTNKDSINSRGTGTPVYGSTQTFNSNGANEIWLPQSAIPAAPVPVPAATQTSISGATINGVAQAAGTLQTLVTATPSGGTLTLPAGTIVGAATVPNACTINGAGMGQTIIDGTGIRPVLDKALLVPLVAGVVISNVTLRNASISATLGDNASGARDSAPGIGLTLKSVEITGCQDGILTFPSAIVLSDGQTHDNGAANGLTHEIYIGGDTTNTATLTNWTSTCGLRSTHALKSRAGTTNVIGGAYTGSPDTTGNVGGSVIDIPDGGVFNANNATLTLSAGASDHVFLTYGEESKNNLAVGDTVTLTNIVFTDNTGTGGMLICDATNFPAAKLVLSGCTYTGTTAPQITGFATVTGAVTKA